jgi:hypothetical protein
MQQTDVSGMEHHAAEPVQLPTPKKANSQNGFFGRVPVYSPIPYFFISLHIVVRLT